MRGAPNLERALERLADERVNTRAVCRKADVPHSRVIDLMRGKVKRPLEEDQLKRLWEAMDILA